MILEGNNYDFDTLLVYYQDEQITASQLIEHASDNMTERYLHFIAKKGLDDNENSAKTFLDWYMDEERDIDEADILDEVDDVEKMEDEEDILPPYESWLENKSLLGELTLSKSAPKICFWRFQNPMSKDIEQCATDTGSSIEDVKKWWRTPDFLRELDGEKLTTPKIRTESQIECIFLNEGSRYL